MKKLIAIKTTKGFYVSDNLEGKEYFRSELPFTADVNFGSTYHKDWYFCENLPTCELRKHPTTYINARWELKVGYPESELIPKVTSTIPDEDVAGLYTYKRDALEGEEYREPVECDVIIEAGEFQIKQLKYEVKHSLIDKITTPSILLVNKATEIDSNTSYAIIRKFVKENIDGNCAKITSDYDFHFEVQKVIKHPPEAYQQSYTKGRSARAKTYYRTDYRRSYQKPILNLQTKGNSYSNSTFAPTFTGCNYEECETKLNNYLEELRIEITTPLNQCECCNGTGVTKTKVDENKI